MKKLNFLIIFVTAVFLGAVSCAFAEDGDDLSVTVCAALLPCDVYGNVIPEFNEGPCAEIYQEQCAKIRPQAADENLKDKEIRSCQKNTKALEHSFVEKDKTIDLLKRQLRRARVAMRLVGR